MMKWLTEEKSTTKGTISNKRIRFSGRLRRDVEERERERMEKERQEKWNKERKWVSGREKVRDKER